MLNLWWLLAWVALCALVVCAAVALLGNDD